MDQSGRIKQLRFEAGYKPLQRGDFKPRYSVTMHGDDGERGNPKMTLDEYEQKVGVIGSRASVADDVKWVGKAENHEMQDIAARYAVKSKKNGKK